MKIGTKSVLFGAHQFLIHPVFVALAWWKLYGFPWDPRLWIAFFVHDLGYLGKPNMDGPEGEGHVWLGARIMSFLFDWSDDETADHAVGYDDRGKVVVIGRWGKFSLYHSRFHAKRRGEPFSKLCVADKLSVALEPWWLYLPRVILSGEIREYMEASRSAALGRDKIPGGKYQGEPQCTDRGEIEGLGPRRAWHKVMTNYCRKWAITHKDCRPDNWTAAIERAAASAARMAEVFGVTEAEMTRLVDERAERVGRLLDSRKGVDHGISGNGSMVRP
jgi:hypothetical protein